MHTNVGESMFFGIDNKRVRAVFNRFADFNASTKPITRVGAANVSNNGIVISVPYRRDKLRVSALLKLGLPKSDNLFYEYMVGLFVNRYTTKFPCLIETFACFQMQPSLKQRIQQMGANTAPIIMKNEQKYLSFFVPPAFTDTLDNQSIKQIALNTNVVSNTCIQVDSIAITTQFFKSRTIMQLVDSHPAEMSASCIEILYQVYSALACLEDKFTHYDLHPGNVLLVPFRNKQCIEYVYHSGTDLSDVVTFRMAHMCKLIDYGRCFFDGGMNGSSLDISKTVCTSLLCGNTSSNTACGKENGYWFTAPNPRRPLNIQSTKRNRSTDLVLAKFMTDDLKQYNPNLEPLHTKIQTQYTNWYYQHELAPSSNSNINTVRDLHKTLRAIIKTPQFQSANAITFAKFTKMGTLHIYENGTKDMVWEPTR